MEMEKEDIRRVIQNHYEDSHPEFIITSRILDSLVRVIDEGVSKAPIAQAKGRAIDSIERYLEKESVLDFVGSRQPFRKPIPDDVIGNVRDYFEEHLSNYEMLHIFRKSNMAENDYLYCVTAINTRDGTYACWSTWNESLGTLNNGHYTMHSEDECINVLQDLFDDITGEQDKYGLLSNSYENNRNKNVAKPQDDMEGQSVNVVPMFRHRNTR